MMWLPTREGNDMEYDLDYFEDTEVYGDEQYVDECDDDESDYWQAEDVALESSLFGDC